MGVEAAQVAIPGAEASTEPIQNAAITAMDSNAPPDGEKRAEEERQDIPESSKRKREASEESHRTARSDLHQNSTTDVTPSYYDPPLNMSALDGFGMEVDSAVSLSLPFPNKIQPIIISSLQMAMQTPRLELKYSTFIASLECWVRSRADVPKRSSTISVRESVYKYVEENGRTYHAFNSGSRSLRFGVLGMAC